MARRKSKWRRTWQTLKKMMQEARKVRAYQSLRQCPACGNPNSLSINIKVDKETDKKSAEVMCGACGFSHVFPEIPVVADEFWVYSRVLDIAHGVKMSSPKEAVEAPSVEIEMPTEEETLGTTEKSAVVSSNEMVEEEGEFEIEEEEGA